MAEELRASQETEASSTVFPTGSAELARVLLSRVQLSYLNNYGRPLPTTSVISESVSTPSARAPPRRRMSFIGSNRLNNQNVSTTTGTECTTADTTQVTQSSHNIAAPYAPSGPRSSANVARSNSLNSTQATATQQPSRRVTIGTTLEPTEEPPKLSLIEYSHGDMEELVRIRGWSDIANLLQSGQLEFCYLKRDPVNPYDLTVCKVPKNLVKQDYITLSLRGIMRYYTDGETEHRTHKEFIREYDTFHKLKQLRIFGKFHLWKPLHRWRSNIILKRMGKRIEALQSKLICSDKFIYELSVLCSSKCYDLSKVDIIALNSSTTYELDHLVQSICHMVTTKKTEIKEFLSNLNKEICRNCEKQNMSLLLSCSTIKTVLSARNAPTEPGEILKLIHSQALTYGERAIMRANCRSVARRIHVLDLLLRDTLYDIVDNSIVKLIGQIERAQKEPSAPALLCIRALFDTKTSKFDIEPSKKAILDSLHPQITSSLHIAYSVHSLLKLKEFERVLIPIASDIKDIVSENLLDRVYGNRNNSMYQGIHKIVQALSVDIDKASTLISSYSFICVKYKYYCNLEQSLTTQTMSEMVSSRIDGHFTMLETDLKFCLSIPVNIKVESFMLDLSDISKTYLNRLDIIKAHLHATLQQVYVKTGEGLFEILFGYKSIFDSDVDNLDDFVKVLIKFNEANEKQIELKSVYDFILALRTIVINHSVESNDAMKELNDVVFSVWQQYNKSRSVFSDNLDGMRKFFMRELSIRTQFLNPLLAECSQYTKVTALNDPDTDEYEALSEIQRASKVMERIFTSSSQLVTYQKIMAVNVFDYNLILNLNEEIQSITTIWTAMEEAKAMVKTVLLTPVFSLDIKSIALRCKKFIKQIKLISRPNVIPDVIARLGNIISDLEISIPVYLMLQEPTLRSRHWVLIHTISQVTIHNRHLTVSDIVDAGIIDKVSELAGVVTASKFEYNLECRLQSLENRCAKMSFSICSDKSKVMVWISNFSQLLDDLKDVEMELQVSMKSAHVIPFIEGYESLLSKLIVWQSRLCSLEVLQEEFRKVRALFTSPRANRYFHKTLKYFKSIDDFWRDIYHSSRISPVVEIVDTENFADLISDVDLNISLINTRIDDFLEAKCRQWPKLYILDKKSVLEIFSLVDIRTIYKKYKDFLLPFSTALVYNGIEWDKTIGIESGLERVIFLPSANISSKDDLVLWFKGICDALTEKLIIECRQFIKGEALISTDLRNPRCTEQSRNFALSAKFWSELLEFNHLKPDRKLMMKLKMKIFSSIASYTTLIADFNTNDTAYAYKKVCGANLLLGLINQRDIIGASSDNDAAFMHECAIKLIWDEQADRGVILQSHFKFDYGNIYQGFGHRLFLTPLTLRVFFSMTLAMSGNGIPALKGTKDSGVRACAREYSHLLGQDMLTIDSEYLKNENTIDRILYGAMKSNALLVINSTDYTVKKFASMILGRLASITSVLRDSHRNGVSQITLNGNVIDIQSVKFKVCVLTNISTKNMDDDWTSKMKGIFRPIYATAIPIRILLSALLSAYGFPSPSELALRFESLIEFLVSSYKSIEHDMAMKVIVGCIRSNGVTLKLQDYKKVSYECLLVILPKLLHDEKCDIEEVMLTCCMFLCTNMNSEATEEEYEPVKPVALTPLESVLAALKCNNSVLVMGESLSGKTSLIRELYNSHIAINRSEGNDTSLQTINLTEVLSANVIESANEKTIEYGFEDYIERLVSILSESFQLAHMLHFDTSYLTYTSLIARWCATMYRSIRNDVCFIWEASDVKNFEPSVFVSVPIVYLQPKSINLDQIIAFYISISLQDLSKGYSHIGILELENTLKSVAKSFIFPIAERVRNRHRSFCYISSRIGNLLKLTSGLMLTSLQRSHYTKSAFSADFQRCLIFAIIWVLGSSFNSKAEFRSIFESVYSLKYYRDKSLFPPLDQIFESKLIDSDDEDDHFVGYYFWEKAHVRCPATNIDHQHAYSHFLSRGQDQLLIPTTLTGILSAIQVALLRNGEIILHGDIRSGKSVLLQQLMGTADHSFRFLCYLESCTSTRIRTAILNSQNNVKSKLYENNEHMYGSLYIEDVSFDIDSPELIATDCSDFLRYFFEHRSFHNLSTCRQESCEGCLTVMSCRKLSSDLGSRLARFPIPIEIEPAGSTTISSVLTASFPHFDNVTGDYLISFVNEVLKETSKQVAVAPTESIQIFPRLIALVKKVIEIVDVYSTFDVITVFTKLFLLSSIPGRSLHLKEICISTLKSNTSAFPSSFTDLMKKVLYNSKLDFDSTMLLRESESALLLDLDQFRDYFTLSSDRISLIPSYIDQSSSQFWIDFQSMAVNIGYSSCNDIHILIGKKTFMMYDLSLLVARYSNISHEFIVFENAESCIRDVALKQADAYIASRNCSHIILWHYYFTFEPSSKEWCNILSLAVFRHELTYDYVREKLGYNIREHSIHLDELKTFFFKMRVVFSFETVKCSLESLSRLQKLKYQFNLVIHSIAEDASYDFDLGTFNGLFTDPSIAISIVTSTHQSARKYLQEATKFNSLILSDDYRHESFRLILEIFRRMSKNPLQVVRNISAEYSKIGIDVEPLIDEKLVLEQILVDSIFLIMKIRYFQYLSDAVMKFELPRLRRTLVSLQLNSNDKFDAVCVLKGIVSTFPQIPKAAQLSSILLGFIPFDSALRKLFISIVIGFLTEKAIVFIDHSSLFSVFLGEVLSVSVSPVYDHSLKESAEILIDRSSKENEALMRTGLPIYIPIHTGMTPEIMALCFVVKGIEKFSEVSNVWGKCSSHGSYSNRSFGFTWKRHIRSYEKGSDMLSAIASAAKRVSFASLSEGIKHAILSPFSTLKDCDDKDSFLSLSVSSALSFLKTKMSDDSYMLFTLYIALKLSAEDVVDPISFIESLLIQARKSNGRCGYLFNARSTMQLTPESHAPLVMVETELTDNNDDELTLALQTIDADGMEWLSSPNSSCSDIPICMDSRALNWIEILLVMMILKPHAIDSTILCIAEDKGIQDASIVLCETFNSKILYNLSELIKKYESYKTNPARSKTIKLVRFHFFILHSFLSVYFNNVSTFHDDSVEFVLQLINSSFDGKSAIEITLLRLSNIPTIVYSFATSNSDLKKFIATTFEHMYRTWKFDNKGNIVESLLGDIDIAISDSDIYSHCFRLAQTAITADSFFIRGLFVSVYDLNDLGRYDLHRALKHLPSSAELVKTLNISDAKRKIDEALELLNFPEILAMSDSIIGKYFQKQREQDSESGVINSFVANADKVRACVESELLLHKRRIKDFYDFLSAISFSITNNLDLVSSQVEALQSGRVPSDAPSLFASHYRLRVDVDLLSYCNDAKKKHDILKTWINNFRPPVLNLKFLEHPKRLLMAMRENFAMIHNVALDSTSLKFSFLTKMTTALIKAIKENRDPFSIYFQNICVINGYYDDTENVLKALPDYSNCILSHQKIVLKVSAVQAEKVKEETNVAMPIPVYVADELPIQWSALSNQFTMQPAFEVSFPFGGELLLRKGRSLALFSL